MLNFTVQFHTGAGWGRIRVKTITVKLHWDWIIFSGPQSPALLPPIQFSSITVDYVIPSLLLTAPSPHWRAEGEKQYFLCVLTRRAATRGLNNETSFLLESKAPRKVPVARHGTVVGSSLHGTVRNHQWSRSVHAQAVPVPVAVPVPGWGTMPSLLMR